MPVPPAEPPEPKPLAPFVLLARDVIARATGGEPPLAGEDLPTFVDGARTQEILDAVRSAPRAAGWTWSAKRRAGARCGVADAPDGRPARRVLADTRRVVGFDGDVAHRWHPARKHPEPVLRGDRPWDGTGAFVYGSVLRRGDRLGLWYQARAAVGGANTHAVAYAESGDGLRWEKPDLGVVPFEGSAANNLTDAVLHFPSVGREGSGYWAVGHAAAGASAYGVDPGYPARGVYRLRSEDGARWRRDPPRRRRPALAGGARGGRGRGGVRPGRGVRAAGAT